MSLWVVRAGRHGEQKDTAVAENVVCHAWNAIPDYSAVTSRKEFRKLYEELHPHESKRQVNSRFSQVWRFAKDITVGDVVALPLNPESAFAFGRVVGDYEYKEVASNVRHIRKVEWIKTLQRSDIPKDILDSMNSALTVFKVSRNNAEKRIVGILATGPDPPDPPGPIGPGPAIDILDLEETARDEILKFVQQEFPEHKLAHLVAAILRAQGYKTEVSPPGPDGGVDILAGSGPHGFDQPRLCVQVKSGSGQTGQSVFNELLGVVAKFNSEQGLLVSWGGFTNAVRKDVRKSFFTIRLWDQGDVVDAILKNYERLDDEIRADLPLKKIWIMVNDDVE